MTTSLIVALTNSNETGRRACPSTSLINSFKEDQTGKVGAYRSTADLLAP